MVFAHLGDCHDRFDVLGQVVDDVLQRAPDLAAWLLPGDVFDKGSTVKLRNALKEVVKRMADRAPVYGCYGNHDAPGDLDIFQDLGAQYPIVFADTPGVGVVPLAGGDGDDDQPHGEAAIFFFPYPTPAGLLARGVAIPDIAQSARQALEVIFLKAGHELAESRKRGLPTLMIGHCDALGAVRGLGQPSVGHDAIAVDDALLSHLGDCPVLLNHIHRAQDVGRASYAGSLCRLTWGEVEAKSYSLLHCALTGNSSDRWHGHVRRYPVNVPPLYHVECRLTRDGVVAWQATQGPDGPPEAMPASWAGTWVRLRAHYRQSEGVVLEAAQREARTLFAEAERFEFEPVCEPDRAVRAPEVAAARTLAEKVQAWAAVTGATLPETALDKLRRLETTDADALVEEVMQELSPVDATETVEA
jgi:hypothetical protein